MKFMVLCIVILGIQLVGVYSKTISTASGIEEVDEKIRYSGITMKNAIIENVTEQIEEKNVLGNFEKFVVDHVAPDQLQAPDLDEGRTFGVKRLQFMLMPMMYKMGVIMTLLMVLTVISLKGLAIGVLLLVLKLSAFFGKFYANAHAPVHGWSTQAQPVHVHLHNNGGGHNHQPYNGWESPTGYAADDGHYYYKG